MDFTVEQLDKMRDEGPCQHCTKAPTCGIKREYEADGEFVIDCEEVEEEEVD